MALNSFVIPFKVEILEHTYTDWDELAQRERCHNA